MGKFGQEFGPQTLAAIAELRPDFILRFGFGILKGEILSCSRYGVWSYHHGDPAHYRGQPPAFWEVYQGSPVTGSVLQVLTEELDAGQILIEGQFPTLRHSYCKTRDMIYLESASWVKLACQKLCSLPFHDLVLKKHIRWGPVYRQPRNSEMLRFMWKTLQAFINNQWRYRLFRQTWNIGVVPAPIHVVAGLEGPEKQQAALASTSWMPTREGRFAADPFGYQIDQETLRIVFEDYNWSRKKGAIGAVEYMGDEFGEATTILDATTHMSYPFVTTGSDGTLYYIPEHSAARNVSAFRFDESGKTEAKKTIFPWSDAIDATFLFWRGRYWCFALENHMAQNVELHLYIGGEHLIGSQWRPHPLNPVKINVRSARPGGTPFDYNGKLYRPSQDCSTHYGSAVVVNEVTVLTEEEYEEIEIGRVNPLADGSYTNGLHTISKVGSYTLIDGARVVSLLKTLS